MEDHRREYFVDFRGQQKAKHVHDVVLWHVMRIGRSSSCCCAAPATRRDPDGTAHYASDRPSAFRLRIEPDGTRHESGVDAEGSYTRRTPMARVRGTGLSGFVRRASCPMLGVRSTPASLSVRVRSVLLALLPPSCLSLSLSLKGCYREISRRLSAATAGASLDPVRDCGPQRCLDAHARSDPVAVMPGRVLVLNGDHSVAPPQGTVFEVVNEVRAPASPDHPTPQQGRMNWPTLLAFSCPG